MKKQTRSSKASWKTNSNNNSNKQSLLKPSNKKSQPTDSKQINEDKQLEVIITKLLKVKFKKQVTRKQIQSIIQNIQDTLIKNVWTVRTNQVYQHFWSRLLSSIEEASCLQFIIYKNHKSQLLTSLTQPFYSKLRSLNISQNNITSLQALSFINAPNLTHLYIYNNKITSLKGLVKLGAKFINVINLDYNKLKSIDQLSRLNCGKGKKQFSLYFRKSNKLSPQDIIVNIQNYIPIAKLYRQTNPKTKHIVMYNFLNFTKMFSNYYYLTNEYAVNSLKRKYDTIRQNQF